MAAHCRLVVTAPVTAQVTTTLSPRAISVLLGAPRFDGALHVEGDLAEQGGQLLLLGRRELLERVMQKIPWRHARLLRHLAAGVGEADDPDAAILVAARALDQPRGLHAVDDAGDGGVVGADLLRQAAEREV